MMKLCVLAIVLAAVAAKRIVDPKQVLAEID